MREPVTTGDLSSLCEVLEDGAALAVYIDKKTLKETVLYAPHIAALVRCAHAMKRISKRLDGMDGQCTAHERQIIEWSDDALAVLHAARINVI